MAQNSPKHNFFQEITTLSEAKQHTSLAVNAGLFSAGATLIFGIVSNSSAYLIDIALILGFSYGIYRYSRICSLLMLFYFIASKIIIAAETSKGIDVLAILFIYFYFEGVRGTFAYHRLNNNTRQ